MKLLAPTVVASLGLCAEATQFGGIKDVVLGSKNETCVRYVLLSQGSCISDQF
jgi:hypothetical protein